MIKMFSLQKEKNKIYLYSYIIRVTSGSGIFKHSIGTSSLNGMIILFGNTTMAAICSTIVLLKISLKK